MGGIFSALAVEIAIITYRGFKGKEVVPIPAPLPADYVGAGIIFGLLSLAGRTQAAPVATLIGWGLVVATLLNLWDPATGKVLTGTQVGWHPGADVTTKTKKTAHGADTYGGGGTPGPVYSHG